MAANKAKSGGGRKIGRGLRSPSHNKYNLMKRDRTNKARGISKHIRVLVNKIKRFEKKGWAVLDMLAEVKRSEAALARV